MTNKHVRWVFNFSRWNPSESDILLATACLQLQEKERIARFVFKKDFKSSLIGHLMMRKFIHESTSIPYNEIKFDRDNKGKPILLNSDHLLKVAFNTSHHGDLTVFVGEIGCTEIGVDVMRLERPIGKDLGEYFRLMRRTFSGSEWEEIHSSGSEQNQIAMFYRHWALKESYVKAIGVGITINLQDICFKINTKKMVEGSIVSDTEIYVNNQKLNWVFQESLVDGQHCIAVAIRNDEYVSGTESEKFVELEFAELVRNAVPLLNYDSEYCAKYFSKQ